ncbi:MAG: oligosaccharide flippase family protein [Oscillatoria sp. PMC 1068.18]|nr:oligosaccharide flippase family protein [Oscillatoria sp. PMC 1076.18]MEC4987686.1 oligosaccharide flippase family protein [Oscillatoria sp. PMC 1068.18]
MNRNSLLKSGFWITYGAIATRILALFSNLILARLLLPEAFGVIAVAYIFWAFVNLFTQGTAGDFLVYKGLEDERYVNTTYTISIIIGLVLALGMVAISPLAASFFAVPSLVWILAIFAVNFLLSSIHAVYVGVLKRRMQYRAIANTYLIASLIRVLATTGCALAGLSFWSFAIGDSAYWIGICILTRRYVKMKFRFQIDSQAKAEVLSFCLGATGSSLGFYVNSNCDNFVIGRLLGSTSLGYYNFAYQLTMALNTILAQIMSQLGMSVFAQLENDKQQEKALLNVVEQIAFLAAPVFSLFFLVIDEQAITLIFKEKWIPATPVIPWLLVFAYFRLINNALFNMLSAKGKPGVNARMNLQIAPIAVLSFIIGAWEGGIVGVSIAVAITLGIFGTIYGWWIGCREMKWPLFKFLVPTIVPALIALPAIFLSLQLGEMWQPFVFVLLYLVFVRLAIPRQFANYQSLSMRALKKLSEKLKRSQ